MKRSFVALAALALAFNGLAVTTPARAKQPPCNEQARWFAQSTYEFDTDDYWALYAAYVDACIAAYPTTGDGVCGNTFYFVDPKTGNVFSGFVPCY